MADDSTMAADQGRGTGRLRVDVDGQRFRVRTPEVSTPWRPAMPSNRHLTVVWCRLMVDAQGKPCFTLRELAALVGSANRQAASQHLADVRQCGEDVRAFVLRQRQVAAAVVEGVFTELLHTPLAGPTELVSRVNGRLGRTDVTAANIEGALAQISCVPVRRTLRRQLAAGQVHDHAALRLTEMVESLSRPTTLPAGWSGPSADRGMRIADPTALAALVTPDLPLAPVPGSLGWLTCSMTLFSWHVP